MFNFVYTVITLEFRWFELMALDEQGAAAAVPQADKFRLSHSFFRRPDKFRIGEDFVLLIKKLNLYFVVRAARSKTYVDRAN